MYPLPSSGLSFTWFAGLSHSASGGHPRSDRWFRHKEEKAAPGRAASGGRNCGFEPTLSLLPGSVVSEHPARALGGPAGGTPRLRLRWSGLFILRADLLRSPRSALLSPGRSPPEAPPTGSAQQHTSGECHSLRRCVQPLSGAHRPVQDSCEDGFPPVPAQMRCTRRPAPASQSMRSHRSASPASAA